MKSAFKTPRGMDNSTVDETLDDYRSVTSMKKQHNIMPGDSSPYLSGLV
jgi:hypothetical protein